jgi:hypothetical protein
VHAGECETVGAKFAGIAVAIGARICALVAVREVEALGLDSESFVPSTRMRCRVSTASSSIAVMGRCRSQRTSLKRHSRTLAQATHRDLHPMLGACAAPSAAQDQRPRSDRRNAWGEPHGFGGNRTRKTFPPVNRF